MSAIDPKQVPANVNVGDTNQRESNRHIRRLSDNNQRIFMRFLYLHPEFV